MGFRIKYLYWSNLKGSINCSLTSKRLLIRITARVKKQEPYLIHERPGKCIDHWTPQVN